MAAQLLDSSHRLWPTDPLVVNELGVLAYQQGDWGKAADHFRAALSHISSASAATSTAGSGNAAAASAWSITACNLGHALRKLRSYSAALAAYHEALAPPTAGAGARLGVVQVGRWVVVVEVVWVMLVVGMWCGVLRLCII